MPGWIPSHPGPDDPQLRDLMSEEVQAVQTRLWTPGEPPLNQGQNSTCVGNGGADLLRCTPNPYPGITEDTATSLYCASLAREGQSCDLTIGTHVSSLAQAMVDAKYISTYGWSTDAAEIRDYVLSTGPVILGIVWYYSMYSVDSNGYIVVDPSSKVAGGHCVLVYGYDQSRDAFIIQNSWGNWGDNGSAWLRFSNLDSLHANGGEWEALGAVKIPPPVPPAPPKPKLTWWQKLLRALGMK